MENDNEKLRRRLEKKKPVFIIATDTGEMPSVVIKKEQDVYPALALCKKGWPDKNWTIYSFKMDKGLLYGKPSAIFDKVGAIHYPEEQ